MKKKAIELTAEEAEGVVNVLRHCAAVLRRNLLRNTLVVGSGSTLWTGDELAKHAVFAAKVINNKRKGTR